MFFWLLSLKPQTLTGCRKYKKTGFDPWPIIWRRPISAAWVFHEKWEESLERNFFVVQEHNRIIYYDLGDFRGDINMYIVPAIYI